MTEQADHTPEKGNVPAPSIEDASTVQNAATSPPAPVPGYAQQPPMQGYPQQPPMQGGYPQQPPMQGGYPQQPPMQGYPAVNVQSPVYIQAPMMGGAYGGPDKSVGVAYLLWCFLGFFGGHQFYLGKAGRGIGYLVTFGWLTIGTWIDLFTLPAQVRAVNAQRRMGIR